MDINISIQDPPDLLLSCPIIHYQFFQNRATYSRKTLTEKEANPYLDKPRYMNLAISVLLD
jgi:hypothetical protein